MEVEGRVGVGLRSGWEPLNGERRPYKRVRDEEIVQQRSVLLPNGELFFNLCLCLCILVLFRHFSFSVLRSPCFLAPKNDATFL